MPQTEELTQEQIAENKLIDKMASFTHDPRAWVFYSFPWGEEGDLREYKGPDVWQDEVLTYITEQLQAGLMDVKQAVSHVIRVAVASGNGPGKSALVAWIILWAISTKVDTRGIVTANTESQLKIKTWAELSKWYRLFIAKHWFELTATAIYAKDREHERTWRIDQVPWSEHNAEAFAGLHNKGKRLVMIFDEASSIPDKIWEVAEGALTDANTEILWLVFGNPTRNTGRFRECWGKFRNRWKQWQLDIRKSILVNQEEVKQWIEDLGIDCDWVRVHVLGLFPHASDLQFIPHDLVDKARDRQIKDHQYNFAPKIIGVDMAWCVDDKTEILTDDGFKYFDKLAGNEKIFSLNRDHAEWMPINEIYKIRYKGTMNNLQDKRGIDFCITDNHKLITKYRRGKWQLREYKDLPNYFSVRRISKWRGKNSKSVSFKSVFNMPYGGDRTKEWKFPMRLWAQFLGWFVSEGCVYSPNRKERNKTYVIEISQVTPSKRIKIENLLTEMGLGYSTHGHSYAIANTEIGRHLEKFCGVGASNKRIPAYIKESTPSIIQEFLNAFSEGDGHKMRGGATYYSSSKKLIDDIQECLIKIGRSGKVSLRCLRGSEFKIDGRTVKRKHDTYTIWQTKISRDGYVKKSKVKRIPYDGYVYCVNTPYHTMLLRRNGVCMWSGNSGGDTVEISIRQGLVHRKLQTFQKNDDDTVIAGAVAKHEDAEDADQVFIDLGYGTGVYSCGKQMNRKWMLVSFGAKSDKMGFANKRAEMWGDVKQWLKEGGCIPDDQRLADDLTNPEATTNLKGQIILESKDSMRRRGLASPSKADSLALTFAYPVKKKEKKLFPDAKKEYDPLS